MGKKIAKLIDVKSIVTLVLTVVFSYLSITGAVDSENFMAIFRLIIVFYFGTQVGKREAKEKEAETDEDNTR